MKDECTNPQHLGDEQLETVSGGAGDGGSTQDKPCRWDAKWNPTHWYDPNLKRKYHYRCKDCGSLLYGIGDGALGCSRCGVFFIRSRMRKVYLDF